MGQDNNRRFWGGFGSALSLEVTTCCDDKSPFEYHGKDIGSTSATEALVSDWLCVGSIVTEVAEREEK
jgi:hypothetical protein